VPLGGGESGGLLRDWLNALDREAQVIVSARPLNLRGPTEALQDRCRTASTPFLQAIAVARAEVLMEVEQKRPLRRQEPTSCFAPGTAKGFSIVLGASASTSPAPVSTSPWFSRLSEPAGVCASWKDGSSIT